MSDYYTLITALPWLPALEQCRQLPLSRIALDKRLTMLSDEDRDQLALLERLYYPEQVAELTTLTDKHLVRQWQEGFNRVSSAVLKERLLFQMELRTVLAALRSRSAGLEHPEQFHGVGRWLPRIRRHWFEPDFGLGEVYPQLKQLQRLQEKRQPLLMEAYLNQQLWQDLLRTEHQHHFQFEALACFFLRWTLAERHLRQSSDTALRQFEQATTALLNASALEQQLAQGNR